jgi:transcriptional regulator with XRE-family HTH domain
MSQSQLARRSGVTRAHIARIEAERLSPKFETLELLFDAMFCDLLVLPKARVRPREAIARKVADKPVPWRYRWRIWDD